MVLMLLRCTGKVLRVDARDGVSTRTGKPWRIPFVTVLVEDQGVAEINVPEIRHAQIDQGETIDWLVEVTQNGGFMSVRYVSDIKALNLPRSAQSPSPVQSAPKAS